MNFGFCCDFRFGVGAIQILGWGGLSDLRVLDGRCAIDCGFGCCYFDCLGLWTGMISFCVAVLVCVVWIFG